MVTTRHVRAAKQNVEKAQATAARRAVTANAGGPVMGDLLETVLDAHGGLERWNQLDTVSARPIQGGVLRAVKGQADAFLNGG
jgi:hypothetical protein